MTLRNRFNSVELTRFNSTKEKLKYEVKELRRLELAIEELKKDLYSSKEIHSNESLATEKKMNIHLYRCRMKRMVENLRAKGFINEI